jgi:hypothetical protein
MKQCPRFDLTILVDDLRTFNQEQAESAFISWLTRNSIKKHDTTVIDNELGN